MTSRAGEVILSIALVKFHLDCVQLWGLQHENDKALLEQVQRRVIRMIRRLENLSHKERLRELGLSSLEKRRLRGNLSADFHYVKRGLQERRKMGRDSLPGSVVKRQGVTALN